ncbi:MAG: hypothetical protein VKJ02_02540 [Snowella sp.]|nr:hypothetical protein [Snowella sp.]
MTVSPPSSLVTFDILTDIQGFKRTWKTLLIFEIKSWIGRHFFQKRKLQITTNHTYFLNLGCGSNTQTGNWVNADFFSGFLPKRASDIPDPDWMLDLRYPLNCPANSWDGVFTEHTLEHFYPDEVLAILNELYRTMKSQAWLRITVPDLQKYIDYHEGCAVDPEFLQWKTGCEAIHFLTQSFFHLSVWNEELLTQFLKMAGFIHIKKVDFHQGTDHRLFIERKERWWESLYIEAQKP